MDTKSREILKFRPKIDFIEPEQEPGVIEGEPAAPTVEEVADRRQRIKKLAEAVNTLAAVVQERIDKKAKDQIIRLDPGIDAAAMQAMRRTYGVDDVITYEQYKGCKDRLRKHGEQMALKATISKEKVRKAKEDMLKGKVSIAGVGTDKAATGGLRPELDENNQVIEPLNMDEFQNELMKVLVNFLWKNFIKPILPIPFLPNELVSVSKKTKQTLKDVESAGGETI